jgi:hypothetical protein
MGDLEKGRELVFDLGIDTSCCLVCRLRSVDTPAVADIDPA